MSLKTFKFLDKSGFSWPQLNVDAISKIGVFSLCLRNKPFDAFKIPTDRHKTSSAKSLISSKNKLNKFKHSDYVMKYGLLIGCHQGLTNKDILYIHSFMSTCAHRNSETDLGLVCAEFL